MKRTVAVGLLFLLGLVRVWASSEDSASSHSEEKPFRAGGQIEMQLESGNYEVRPATGNVIRVTLSGNTGDAKVVLSTKNDRASLEISDTPNNNFSATIEVPPTSDLRIRLTAGNLVIGPIDGNKDVESHAGNVEIAVGEPEDYSSVDGSVRAGNVQARVFHVSKSGLFRSFQWSGPGSYTLHAHLGAGNLKLSR